MLSFVLALALAPGHEMADPAVAPESTEPTRGFRTAFVSTQGVDQDEALAGLSLRVPDLDIRTEWDIEAGAAGLEAAHEQVFLSLRRDAPDAEVMRIEVITGDGRGYARTIDAAPGDTRVAITMLANLLFSIERDAVAADLKNVELPTTSDQEDVGRAVAQVEAATQPRREPEPEPKQPTETRAQPRPTPPPVETKPPSWEIGVPLGAGVLLAIGAPAFAGIFQGGGAELGLEARAPGGAMFGVRVRPLVREVDRFRLTRVRIALAAGYGIRDGALEVPLLGEVSVEPWRVADSGNRVSNGVLGTPANGAVLFGIGARAEPGYLATIQRGPLAAIRLGASIGLTGSFVLDRGARVGIVSSSEDDALGDDLFRLGGLELYLGLGATLWFEVSRRGGR